ncbi:MAG TPA: hypothetical protein VK095_04730 [Beutenbergiaceae bacterium]|nr:hypothetical protein [Beutenbergiaceae bacterium]
MQIATYDLIWSILLVPIIVVTVLALRAWFRARPPGPLGIVQGLVIILIPVLGPIAYLVATADERRRRAPGTPRRAESH